MLYIVVIFCLIIFSYRYDFRNQKKGKREAYFFCLLIFILIAGLRYRLGVDSIRYESQYSDMPTFSELFSFDFSSVRADPGYVILNSIARSFSDSFVTMQIFHAAFVNTAVFAFFKENTTKIFTAVFLYFVFPFMYIYFMCEVMRESCAVACFLMGWKHFKKKLWLKYYFWTIAAVLCHASAIVTLFLPLLYLPGLRALFVLDKRILLILIITFFIGEGINVWLFDYIQTLSLLDSLQSKAAYYAGTAYADSTNINIKGLISFIIRILYPWSAFSLLCKNDKRIYNNNHELEFILSICFIFTIMSIPIMLLYRYTNYFYPFAIIAISNGLFQPIFLRHKKVRLSFITRFLILFPLIGLSFLPLFKTIPGTKLSDSMRYYPYSSCIFPQKDQNREKVFSYYNAW